MIKVIFMIDIFGNTMGFDAQGHSGYAPRGQDIICSAISSTTQMTLFAIVKEAEKETKYEFKDERIWLFLKSYKKCGDPRIFMLGALRDYIEGLQKQYPNHISVEYEMAP